MDLPASDPLTVGVQSALSVNHKAAEYLAYASQCYQVDDDARPDSCRVMTIPAVPITVDGNASCPFAPEMCKHSSGNLRLDTGVLDSYTHFGMNAGPRLTMQVTERCAPIVTAGFSKSFVDPDRGNKNYTRYYYGGGYFNHTFEVANNVTSHTSDGTGEYKV